MSADQTAPPRPDPQDHSNRWIYWVVGAVVVILLIIGLISWSTEKNTQEAQAKAQQLNKKFTALGLPVPAKVETITRVLGTDGGVVCDNPATALGKATLNDMLTNGADFVGRRPVQVDRRIVLGELVILQTYCPEQLQAYKDKINDLKFDNVVKF